MKLIHEAELTALTPLTITRYWLKCPILPQRHVDNLRDWATTAQAQARGRPKRRRGLKARGSSAAATTTSASAPAASSASTTPAPSAPTTTSASPTTAASSASTTTTALSALTPHQCRPCPPPRQRRRQPRRHRPCHRPPCPCRRQWIIWPAGSSSWMTVGWRLPMAAASWQRCVKPS